MPSSPNPPLGPMYSSARQSILLLLKRRPGASLQEIAEEMGISKAGVLGHLPRLESDGLVERAYQAGHVGRPRVVFRLTNRAVGLFPHGYTEMSLAALEFVERKLGTPAVAELLQQRAHDVEERHRAQLAPGDLSARVQQLAQIRIEGGYMAEIGPRRKGSIEFLEHNCPILALADRFPIACETERRMFESLLRAKVEVTHRVVAGDAVCRFRILPVGAGR